MTLFGNIAEKEEILKNLRENIITYIHYGNTTGAIAGKRIYDFEFQQFAALTDAVKSLGGTEKWN